MKVQAPPIPMIIMFNTYFELASNNNAGESIAFVVAEVTFKMAVMTSPVAKIGFFVANITLW